MNKLRHGFLLSFLLLTGCGFSPIYAGHGEGDAPVAAALQNISIANIPDRSGQILRNHLIDRFYSHGRPTTPTAKLSVTLREHEEDLGIQKDATATRRQLEIWANYSLRDTGAKELVTGTAHSVVSYNKLEAQYGNVTAKRNAQERALKEVGEQIVNRISLYYAQGPVANP